MNEADAQFIRMCLLVVVVGFVVYFLLAPPPKVKVIPPKPVVAVTPTNIVPLNKQDLETVREFLKP